MKFIIHVNQHHIKANVKEGTNLPPYTIKMKRKNWATVYAWSFKYTGTISGENHMHDPLSCGARIYLTAEEGLIQLYDADGKEFAGMTYTEAKSLYGESCKLDEING